ncbi:hypothetical protein [Candidatus Marithrix sp. Canyon 246]|uniref:hypothetical protein n=1 Tax=Candidatus Marithrix sp. Canyon 246 TaxID=1827136 RepID=UPI000849F447|nr:hypothetical protein [Candidatus Marithrix sp. Canyon 246]
MPEFETQVEKFAIKIIDLHGFRFNEGFSCLIPDDKVYPLNEGLFLWGFNKKRMRFETKIEKFHTASRINRMNEMLGVSETEYKKIYTAIDSYLESLKKLGFTEIGKGVAIFGRKKLFNVTAEAKIFENNVAALKEFEKITINSQIMKFAEKNNYFKAKNKTKSAWDTIFAAAKPKAKPKAKAAPKKKVVAAPKKVVAAPKKVVAAPKKVVAAKVAKKPAATSKRSATLADKFKKMATANKPKTSVKTGSEKQVWAKEVNGLHKTIKTWLNDYSKNGYISFSTSKVKLHDEDVGNYEVNALELDILGGHKIVFQPMEIGFIGAIGRIDVTHIAPDDDGHKHMMLLIKDSKDNLHWKLWKNLNIGNQLAFNKQMLDELLNQWIEF